MTDQETCCDVAIVGAGVSGLAAAHFLLKARSELRILVLEAADRVGGRTLTKQVRCSDGQSRGWCLGASRLGKGHKRALALVRELGLTTLEVTQPTGRNILELGDTVERYEGDTPNLGALTLLDLDRSLKALDKQAKTLMENRGSWAALDGMTLAKKIEKETFKRSTRQCLTALTEPCFDGGVDRISSLHALRIANSAGGLMALMSEGDGLRIAEGAQAICTRLADRLGPDRVLLGRKVVAVTVSESPQSPEHPVHLIVTRSSTGDPKEQQHVAARCALITLPLGALTHLRFSPELPPAKRIPADVAAAALSAEASTAVVSAVVTCRTPFWRAAGYTGGVLSHLGKPLSKQQPAAPVAIATEVPSPDGYQTAALALLTGYTAEHRWGTTEERRADLLAHLRRLFQVDLDKCDVVDYVEQDWGLGQPAGASPLPAGSGGAGSSFCDHAALTEPIAGGRVHFAGTDFAAEWIGSVEGAVESAARAAEQLLARLQRDD